MLDRYLRYLKYLVLAWTAGGAAYFGVMVFRDYDPWSTLLNLNEFSFTPGLIVLVVTLVAAFFVEQDFGPGLEERLQPNEVIKLTGQAGFISRETYRLEQLVLYRLDKGSTHAIANDRKT